MSTITLEERVALLEQEVLAMKRQIPKSSAVPWWEQISGVFADTPAFDEAMASDVVHAGRRHRGRVEVLLMLHMP